MQLSALRVFKTPEITPVEFFLQKQALTGFLQNKSSKQEGQQVYLKSTSPRMFSSYKISKGKNKDFARQNADADAGVNADADAEMPMPRFPNGPSMCRKNT